MKISLKATINNVRPELFSNDTISALPIPLVPPEDYFDGIVFL